ncbi:MAG: hydrogenase maturation protease [Deltaproteobacteria bacterium]|nr:hydrogenase maturation protease [Deltaproteobacteria bacterium]MCW5809120.1 hydrogenase maturation protease [Deltaproteobacteria bacterium]
MTRVLVAGIGNLFFGDDGFGVELARRLAASPPPRARVVDYGIRAVHLAYELLEPLDLLVVADCVSRGGAPGSLYLIEPDGDELAGGATGDAHGMNLPIVFATVRELGGALPPTFVVGCEPETLDLGMGLSAAVAGVLPAAADLVRELIASRP